MTSLHPFPASARTDDGQRIVPGMAVWTINMRRATVTEYLFEENGAHWFDTTDGMFDGSRMATFHPSTRERASSTPEKDALVALAKAVGFGFHPDTAGEDYVHLPDAYTPELVDWIVASADAANVDTYEVTCDMFDQMQQEAQ